MNKRTKQILFWSPRILCILFALITAILALDVFRGGPDFWRTFLKFLMHLIPSAIIVLALVISWRREWIGGVIFSALAVCYIILTWGNLPLSAYFLMCGPLVLISILFFINWKYKSELQSKQDGG